MSAQRVRNAAAWRRPALAVAALAVLGAVGWAVVAWRAGADAARARRQVLADIEVALAQRPVDGSELSRCMAALQRLPDHDRADDLLAAVARIELARDRPERADAAFAAIANRPGASPAQRGLGARIVLRRDEGGGLDPALRPGLLRQAMEHADECYRAGRDAADLLRVWLAAERLQQHERSAAAAQQLAADHADSPEHAFVALALAFDPARGTGPIDAVASRLPDPPLELEALRTFALLQGGDVAGALRVAEAALQRGPGLGVVRWAAAVVFHACVVGSAGGSDDRAAWVARRDPQLDWLLRSGVVDADRRARCEQMLQVR